MPATASYSLTGNAYIDGVLGDTKWAVSNLTFSFPTDASYYGAGYGNGEPTDNFGALNSAQQATAHSALAMVASIANLGFSKVTESSTQHGDIRFGMSDAPSTAWAYLPSTAAEGGDIWFNSSRGYYDSPVKGNYANATFLHELGHALGLEHTHEHYVMPADRDSMEYSIMSYNSYVGATEAGYTNEKWGYAQSLMMYDIAALQHMYGADYGTNSGNTTYKWSPTTGEMFVNGAGQGAPGGNRVFLTVWDGGGTDTYDFSNYTTALKVDLRPGQWTTTASIQLAKLHYDGSEIATGNIANALLHNGDNRSVIENAKTGAANDVVIGNGAANTLLGNGGSDMLYGQGGEDHLYGQSGNDRLFGQGGNDTLLGGDGVDILNGGAGADILNGGASFDYARYSDAPAGVTARIDKPTANSGHAAGDSYVSIEGLIGSKYSDILVGNGSSNRINGGAGADRLFGCSGSDTLIGGAGADRLSGGLGSDIFDYRRVSDSLPNSRDVIEDFSPGVDKIDLSGIDANSNAAGDQEFLFLGNKAFTGNAGELNFANCLLSGDVNGDRIADFQVNVLNVSVLVESDILL
jgi:serralysin